jgi:hypothetical protein
MLLRVPPVDRLARSCAALAVCVVSAATAQLRPPPDALLAGTSSLPLASGLAAEGLSRSSFSLLAPVRAVSALPAWKPLATRASLIEMPSTAGLGQPTRRHYAFGLRSDSFKAWLTDLGVDTDHCVAPIVRMSSRIESNGDLRGTFWVYARCSLR